LKPPFVLAYVGGLTGELTSACSANELAGE
jgi:hypothetical protein